MAMFKNRQIAEKPKSLIYNSSEIIYDESMIDDIADFMDNSIETITHTEKKEKKYVIDHDLENEIL